MIFEQSPLPAKKEALDEKWFSKFEKEAFFEVTPYLNGNEKYRDGQKDLFLNGKIENPTLDYPELEKFDFNNTGALLLELKKDILKNEPDATIRQLYRWKINEKIAELRMLRAAKDGDDKRFIRYSKFIYGNPEKEIYEYSVSQLKKLVDEKLFANNPLIKDAAKRLNAELFETLMENETQLSPADYPFKEKKDLKNEKAYSTEEIKRAFEDALREYALDDWQIFIDTEGKYKSVTVMQKDKKIALPKNRSDKETELKALIAHEIGTHAARRKQGEKSKLKLLSLGLDRYIKGEEGIAKYRQQEIMGTDNFAGLDYHLAISLAVGMDGKKRNFREVYKLLKDFYLIRSKKAAPEALELSKKYAWQDCVRIFHGTSGKTRGACFTKDIVYREGNIGVWNIVKNNPAEIKRFSVGKYDPTNPRHIWILEQLNIDDSDLDHLEK